MRGLLLFLLCANLSFGNELRLFVWNIDGSRQAMDMERTLLKHEANLYALQEVDLHTRRSGGVDVASKLSRQLKKHFAFERAFNELSQSTGAGQAAFQGQATLADLCIERSRVIRFSCQSGFWKPHSWLPSSWPILQRRDGGRIALVTELRHPNGLSLVVYNLHLESRNYGRIQLRQLDEVLADAKQYGPEAAILIVGDLNSKYAPSKFLHHMNQAGYRSAFGDKVQRTHRLIGSLDWIFFRGPLTLKSATVMKDAKGSDHFPILAVFATASNY